MMAGAPITFATPENMNIFWGFVKTLLGFASPWVMLAVAIISVGLLLVIVVAAFKQAAKKDDNDEDEVEIRHY